MCCEESNHCEQPETAAALWDRLGPVIESSHRNSIRLLNSSTRVASVMTVFLAPMTVA